MAADQTHNVAEASASVGVNCGACGAFLGDQYRPGDGIRLFRNHLTECPNQPRSE